MSNLFNNEAARESVFEPNRKWNLVSKAIDYCKGNMNEVLIVSSVALGAVALAGGILKLCNDQDEGIKRTLDAEAAQTIHGYESISVDGTMWNYTTGSLHGATIKLESGSKCSIQFTTTEEGGWFSRNFFPDHAKIVSLGTCPAAQSVGK